MSDRPLGNLLFTSRALLANELHNKLYPLYATHGTECAALLGRVIVGGYFRKEEDLYTRVRALLCSAKFPPEHVVWRVFNEPKVVHGLDGKNQ